MISGYKCKKCGYQTKVRGYHNAQFDITKHFKENHRVNDLFGRPDLVEAIESKPAKKWKCPDCKKEMSYDDKYFHNQNRKEFCIKS